MKTRLGITGRLFTVNGSLTYSELPDCPREYRGMLMNARMIQGIFDDRKDRSRFDRFGRVFDPEKNTDDLIAALPRWYAAGLRAVTVGFQGGGPCFTVDARTLDNNAFSEDGSSMDPAYLARMERIIRAADDLGMIVIVSFFYCGQCHLLRDDEAVMTATKTASNWLRDKGFTNVIIEVANEHDVLLYRVHPILFESKGICVLMDIAKRESGGMPVGCSATGGVFHEDIALKSDVILVHGNECTRQKIQNLLDKCLAVKPERPVVINEDSQALSDMAVCVRSGVSWGYYNNMTKQEPPTDWTITEGEDRFFADRVSMMLGIQPHRSANEYCLMGLKECETTDGKRWIRLASLWPEQVDSVDFYRGGRFFSRAWDDPFVTGSVGLNWIHMPVTDVEKGEIWTAVVHNKDGTETTVSAAAE